MNCEDMKRSLPGYLRGEDTPGLEDHLRGCEDCRAELEDLRPADALLAAEVGPAPAPDLSSRTFDLVAVEPFGGLLGDLHRVTPPEDLEERALTRAGVLKRRSRATRVLAPGLAAALVAIGFFGMRWRNQADEMTQQFGDPGTTLQQVSFAGPSPFPPGGGADLEIVHYSHDNYGVVIEVKDLPICRFNYHYEVWMSGDGGDVLLGSFKVPGKDVYNFPIGLDPSEYDEIQITHEPVDSSPMQDGGVLWEASLEL